MRSDVCTDLVHAEIARRDLKQSLRRRRVVALLIQNVLIAATIPQIEEH